MLYNVLFLNGVCVHNRPLVTCGWSSSIFYYSGYKANPPFFFTSALTKNFTFLAEATEQVKELQDPINKLHTHATQETQIKICEEGKVYILQPTSYSKILLIFDDISSKEETICFNH